MHIYITNAIYFNIARNMIDIAKCACKIQLDEKEMTQTHILRPLTLTETFMISGHQQEKVALASHFNMI